MAEETSYEKTSFSKIIKVISWCRNKLNMRDWEISVEYGDEAPFWDDNAHDGRLGSCTSKREYYKGWIWVSPARCKKEDTHPVAVVIHEMLHLFFTNNSVKSDEEERMVCTLECILFEAWAGEQKKKKKGKR